MTRANTTVENRLAVAADVGEFTEAELKGCDQPVALYFRAAIASGTPLARAARVRMRGSIKFGSVGHIRVALSDLNAAMRLGQDTPMHCYRAVESVRQHFALSPSDTKASWVRMREALGVSREVLDDLAEAAKPRRHGEARAPIAGQTRRDYISVARLVVWRFAIHLLRESGRDDRLRAAGSWEPLLTEPMARLQDRPEPP